jgi:hypothetical protein
VCLDYLKGTAIMGYLYPAWNTRMCGRISVIVALLLSGCMSWGSHPTLTPEAVQISRPKLRLTFEGKPIGDNDPNQWIKEVVSEFVDILPGAPGPREQHMRVEWHHFTGPERLMGLFTLIMMPIWQRSHYGAYVQITDGTTRKVGEANAAVTFAMGYLLLPAVPFVWLKDIKSMRKDLLRVAINQSLQGAEGPAPQALQVNTQNRLEVINFYKSAYLASNDSGEWVPGVEQCDPGRNPAQYYKATALRINYFRAMAGVLADVEDRQIYNHLGQQAAVIVRANDEADHFPSPFAVCYSEDGAIGAAYSNLSPARRGPKSVESQMHDWGDINFDVGHRRKLLRPETKYMGFGSTDRSSAFFSGGLRFRWLEEPQLTPTMWPPGGFVPYQFGYLPDYRWSIFYPGASFSSATVSMQCGGVPVKVRIEPFGIGIGSLVWQPDLPENESFTSDVSCAVNIANVHYENEIKSISYTITFFDPSRY